MQKTLNALALGYAGATISALCMLIFGILGMLGFYTEAISMMQVWHIFFSLSVVGIIAGIIEATIAGFISFYIFGIIYNWFAK